MLAGLLLFVVLIASAHLATGPSFFERPLPTAEIGGGSLIDTSPQNLTPISRAP
jgi:hypothetical protein